MAFPRRFLVPSDLTTTSEEALVYALGLARVSDGYVLLLHVVEPPPYHLPESLSAEVTRIDNAAHERAGEALARMAARHQGHGIPVHVVVRRGTAWKSIADTAQELDFDLVLMRAHSSPDKRRPLLGSTTDRVVRASLRPVLVLPGQMAEHRPEVRPPERVAAASVE